LIYAVYWWLETTNLSCAYDSGNTYFVKVCCYVTYFSLVITPFLYQVLDKTNRRSRHFYSQLHKRIFWQSRTKWGISGERGI